jgi:hypothetical protein
LQRLPAALRTVVGQISGNRVGVKLRVKFAAGIVMVNRQYKITRDAVIIRPVPSDAARCAILQLFQRFLNGLPVSFHKSGVPTQLGHDGN